MTALLTDQLAALAHPQRLAIYRLLMRLAPSPLPAGQIGALLDLRPSTLSGYLAQLADAGLIAARRQGTTLLYSATLDRAQALADALHGQAMAQRLCDGDGPLPQRRVRNLLFVCTDNARASLLAEALLRHHAGAMFECFSAGTDPAPAPDAAALDLLGALSCDVDALWTKAVVLFQTTDAPRMDMVITLDDRVALADMPPWPGHPVCIHWPLPDAATAADLHDRLMPRLAGLRDLDFTASRRQILAMIDALAAPAN